MKYRIIVSGVKVIEAESEGQAEELGRKNSGLMDARCECLGPVEEQSMAPDSARHTKPPRLGVRSGH